MIRRTWCLQGDGTPTLGPPKTDAGTRPLEIPPNVLRALKEHLATISKDAEAWLFPGEDGRPASPRSLDRAWYHARSVIGRPDLRLHDLRHTGLTLAAATGATTADLMRRAGHSSPTAALRYQHASPERDRLVANALGKLAKAAKVVELRRTKDGRSSGSAKGEVAS